MASPIPGSYYRRRTFAGRHPVLTFLVAPVPITLIGWIAGFVLFAMPAFASREAILRNVSIAAFEQICDAMMFLAWFVPLSAITAWYGRLAYRSGRGWPWFGASCILLALLRGAFTHGVTHFGDGHGRLELGFTTAPHLLPMLVPLAIGLACVWWRLEPRRRATAA